MPPASAPPIAPTARTSAQSGLTRHTLVRRCDGCGAQVSLAVCPGDGAGQLAAQLRRPQGRLVRPVPLPLEPSPWVAELDEPSVRASGRERPHIQNGVSVFTQQAHRLCRRDRSRTAVAAAARCAAQEACLVEREQPSPLQVCILLRIANPCRHSSPAGRATSDRRPIRGASAVARGEEHADGGEACQRPERLVDGAALQRFIRPVQLGHRLLDEPHPQLAAPRRTKGTHAPLCTKATPGTGDGHARQAVVDEQRPPLASRAQAHLIRARRVGFPSRQDSRQQPRPLSDQRQGGEQPAVAERALPDVVGRSGAAHYLPRATAGRSRRG
eukprot:scaffold17375_cov102-Isochrysis_galbana.AAC.8